jgi:putative methylase
MALKQTKKGVAMLLSALEGFRAPRAKEEQYITDPETAAEALWQAFMQGDIDGKTIADLGSGTGILGLGAMLLGARRVFFVEKDKEAMHACGVNFEKMKESPFIKGEADFFLADISGIDLKADVVVENPPFGTKTRHADREFLEKAFETAPVVYSFHKTSTEKFVRAFSDDKGFKVTHKLDFDFPLKKTYKHQKKRIHRIKVSLFRMEKK